MLHTRTHTQQSILYAQMQKKTFEKIFKKQLVGSDAQLAPPGESKYNCSSSTSYRSIFIMTYKPRKLGQTDLLFGL